MENEEYSIGELAKLAGVSARTIRYYVSEGLLPKPKTRGRYTYYDASYLERIQFVRRLKESFLPLKEIRRIVERSSIKEIKTRLSEKDDSIETKEPSMEGENQFLSGKLFQEEDPSQRWLNQHESMTMVREQVILYQRKNLWRREVIVTGVELHFEQPEDEERAKKLARCARKIYQTEQS